MVSVVITYTLFSQEKKYSREDYIHMYKDLAVKEMHRTGIPASITLAQGILESGNGNSRLAVKANNHFGIKCHDWKGKKIHHTDDAWKECFRKYKNVYDSYMDHSDFLTRKKRYASLFEYKTTDYKSWAYGLKKAGYATSPTYAEALIRIIEENKLNEFDTAVDIPKSSLLAGTSQREGRVTGTLNRIKYIKVKEEDTFGSLAKELDLLPWELHRYNELENNAVPEPGQILFIQPKRNKAEAGNNYHMVKEGDTMYSISQLYGIKLDKLYRKNTLEYGTELNVGDKIYLRKPAQKENRKLFSKSKKESAKPALFETEEDQDNEEEMIFEFDLED